MGRSLGPPLRSGGGARFLRAVVLCAVSGLLVVPVLQPWAFPVIGGLGTTEESGSTALAVAAVVATLLFALSLGMIRHARRSARKDRPETCAQELLNVISDRSADAIYIKDTAGRYLLFNRAAGCHVGRDSALVIGQDDRALFPQEEASVVMAKDRLIMEAGQIVTYEEFLTTAKGIRRFQTTKGPVYDRQAQLLGLFGIGRDVTDARAAELKLMESEQRYRVLFENMLEGFAYHEVIYDGDQPIDYRYLAVNKQFEILTGLNDAVGKTVSELIPDLKQRDHDLLEIYFRVTKTGKPERFERFVDAMGMWFLISVYSTDRKHFAVLFDNITERKQAEEKIAFLAYHDNLTGLPNRVKAEEWMRAVMAHPDPADNKCAFLFLDIDNFKAINDSMGHGLGDQLIKRVADRLQEVVRDADIVSRRGGDEFLIGLSVAHSFDAIVAASDRILKRLAEPFAIGGQEIHASASLGIAVCPEDGRDFDTLVKKADTAMYHAKEAGRNTYRFFDDGMKIGTDDLLVGGGLRRALDHGELVLHYQPQIDLGSGAVVGAEALIRWHHPDRGLLLPGHFIPVAEGSGLIVPIGAWVLQEACRQAAAWQAAGLTDLMIGVNLSAVQFRRGDLEETVAAAIRDSGIDPRYLELELTESILIKDSDNALVTVHQLKAIGVQLSIDDFGTGYSSLSYLKRFKVDRLKIDRSFVRDLEAASDNAAIVQAIIQMAKSLKLRTIAEGVENASMMEYLKLFHCDQVQGYYISRPMPAEEFQCWMIRRNMAQIN